MSELNRLWGARFAARPDPALAALSRSPASHFRLVPYDIASSRAHANELARAGLLTADECSRIRQTLAEISDDHRAGKLVPGTADEDVHTFLERMLTERLGPLGGKLRAGRSRNDQAANDLKLYLRDEARRCAAHILELQAALCEQAAKHFDSVAPGFTHLQPGQPVVFAHQLLAHAQSFARDVERLRDWDRRAARSPLGAAAMAGSAIAVRPELSAAELGYDGPAENSMDAVGARDHVAEFLFALAMHGVHLSRLSEEIILWSSRQFRWVALDDAFATGSSIMPQKKNADVAELARGKSARLIGDLATMLIALKGLPLTYNRDLIEDKAAAFDAIETLSVVLPAMAGLVRTMRVDTAELRRQSTQGYTLATEIADRLAMSGVPFASAHEIAGAAVRACEAQGKEFDATSPEEFAAVDARLDAKIVAGLTPEAAVAARTGYGGTAPARVREQFARLEAVLAGQRAWAAAYEGPKA